MFYQINNRRLVNRICAAVITIVLLLSAQGAIRYTSAAALPGEPDIYIGTTPSVGDILRLDGRNWIVSRSDAGYIMLLGIDYINTNRYYFASKNDQTQYEGSSIQGSLTSWYQVSSMETIKRYAVNADNLSGELSSPSVRQSEGKDVIFPPSKSEITSSQAVMEKLAVYTAKQATSVYNINYGFWTRTQSADYSQIFVFRPDVNITYSIYTGAAQLYFIRPAVWTKIDIAQYSSKSDLTPAPTYISTPSATPIVSPKATSTPTYTPAPSNTFTPSPTSTYTLSPSPSSTCTPSPSPTHTPSSIPTSTLTPIPVLTSTQVPAPSSTSTPTPAFTPTTTLTPTKTPAFAPTFTPTKTPTVTPTTTPASTKTPTSTPSPSSTPTIGVPTPEDGNILTPEKSGDSANWIEIAKTGGYSLIIRQEYIKLYYDQSRDVSWHTINFSSNTNNYRDSVVRTKVNAWFQGTSSSQNLAANARLRDFTVKNDALSMCGTANTDAAMTNGLSKPTSVKDRSGLDVAFVLSFSEASNFVSTKHCIRPANPMYQPSNSIAADNYEKLKVENWNAGIGPSSIWLRTPGDNPADGNPNNLTAAAICNLSKTGKEGVAFQIYINYMYDQSALIYPALWVDSAIFEK